MDFAFRPLSHSLLLTKKKKPKKYTPKISTDSGANVYIYFFPCLKWWVDNLPLLQCLCPLCAQWDSSNLSRIAENKTCSVATQWARKVEWSACHGWLMETWCHGERHTATCCGRWTDHQPRFFFFFFRSFPLNPPNQKSTIRALLKLHLEGYISTPKWCIDLMRCTWVPPWP